MYETEPKSKENLQRNIFRACREIEPWMHAKESCRFREGQAPDVHCRRRPEFSSFYVNKGIFIWYVTIEHHNSHCLVFSKAWVDNVVYWSMTCWCFFLWHILSINARSSIPVEFLNNTCLLCFFVLPETAGQKALATLNKNELNVKEKDIYLLFVAVLPVHTVHLACEQETETRLFVLHIVCKSLTTAKAVVCENGNEHEHCESILKPWLRKHR